MSSPFEDARAGGVIDLFLSLPDSKDKQAKKFDNIRAIANDAETKEMAMPAQYMFKNVPKVDAPSDPVHALLELMDKYGIERAMIGVSSRSDDSTRALRDHPDRFFGCMEVDPNRGMEAVRDLFEASGVAIWRLDARRPESPRRNPMGTDHSRGG